MSLPRGYGMSLTINFYAACLRFSFLHLVLFHTSQEIISTFGMFHMFNSKVDSLGNDAVPQLPINDNTDSSSCHVEHSSCFTVVIFVRHSFMDCPIALHIDNITNFVSLQVR